MRTQFVLVLFILAASLGLHSLEASDYDPLNTVDREETKEIELTVKDSNREREIPLLIYLPNSTSRVPVVLFSHGLGGSNRGCRYLGLHWAARGFVAVFVQHPGSDTSVWQEVPVRQRMQAMQQAASLKNLMLRIKDIPAVLDQLEKWNNTAGHALYDRLDVEKIGMSGHSFGAVTTQAVGGQTSARGRISFTDSRIRAAIAFSQSSPRGGAPKSAFGKVNIPWLLMTGTKDHSVIGNADMDSRLAVFPALPPGDKYEVLLDRAEHSAFTERPLPGDTEQRNPNHHRVVLAISTAFWDCYLNENDFAKNWLKGEGPKAILEAKDRWQIK